MDSVRGDFMSNFFSIISSLFTSLSKIFSLRLSLGGYSFSLGSIIIGFLVLNVSVWLLAFLIHND
jgi:hypothetical protein